MDTMSTTRQHTLADLFTFYQAEYLSNQAPATQYNHTKFYAQVLRDLGPLPLADLTPEVLCQWKLRLMARYQKATVQNYMERLSTVLTVAVDDYQWLPAHPMRRIRKPGRQPGRVRFLSEDERIRLLAACRASRNDLLYAIVTVALWTGGRKEEVRTLRWSEVDFAAGRVSFLRTKTRRPRTVPLLGEAFDVLRALAAKRHPSVPWVFPRGDGLEPCPIEYAWLLARRKSGVKNFRFHDLRHTFASYMALSGATLRDIAELLGHSKIQQTLIYLRLTSNHTEALVRKMAVKFLASQPGEGQSDA